MKSQYDYIIVGSGAAGLSLAMHMADDPFFNSRSVLIIDRSEKNTDDRTWCFWEAGEGLFEKIVYARWKKLSVKHERGDVDLDLGPYTYKMVRGIDFYQYCIRHLKQNKQFSFIKGEVSTIDAQNRTVVVNGSAYTAGIIFSSVLLSPPVLEKNDRYLLQHFRGWWIETETDFFDPDHAELMDFRTRQDHGCTFVYVMPVGKRKALVEYTVFSEDKLKDEEYDLGLKEYVEQILKPGAYWIQQIENGVIPMTGYRFPTQDGRLVYIGTAGGATKPSTGYTFQSIQKHSMQIIRALKMGHQSELGYKIEMRFRLYDRVLLRVLDERKMRGADIFYGLFQHNPSWWIFKFLDNETNFLQELRIMNHTPRLIFLKATLAECFA